MAISIFNKKSVQSLISDSAGEKFQLKRSLGRWNLISLGIGAVIGAGIFVITGGAAALFAGPGVTFSFIIAAIACAFAGLCFAEFASMIPVAGSAYTYAYATMGEFSAWIIGWVLILEYLFSASTVAVGWSGYVDSFLQDLGIRIPAMLASAPLVWNTEIHQFVFTGSVMNLPAIIIMVVISVLLMIGIRESASFNNIFVVVKVAVILAFIGFGFFYINPDNWHPFIPENPDGQFGNYGISGILRAAGIIFFAYVGFDNVSTAAQEAKNPQKDMVWGILGSLFICTLLYILVSLVMTGMVGYEQLNSPAPIAVAVNAAGDDLFWLRYLIKIGAIAGLSTVILVSMLGQSRIFYSMSSDGLLPPVFRKVHHKFKTPFVSTIITGIMGCLIAGIFPIDILGELVSIGTLLAFVIVSAGVLILRYKQPDIHRPFKTPLFPYIPILGFLSSLFVMFTLPMDTWLRLVVWMIAGILIYFIYSRSHSKLRR